MKTTPALFAAVCGFTLTAFAQTADTIYHNGSILTMAGKSPAYVEALAAKGGKIALAGSKDAALKMKGDTTKVVDLGGKALLPGFLDGHGHYINSLSVANQCKLYAPPSGRGKDVPRIIAAPKKFTAERKGAKGELIMGYGDDDTVMPGGRLLNRDDLDAAFPDNPVRVDHVSMHGGVLNSLALKKYGLGAETKTPAGGVIVRKPGIEEPWGRGTKGTLETGKLADLVILDRDPLKVSPMAIEDIQVVETIKAGKMIYSANQRFHQSIMRKLLFTIGSAFLTGTAIAADPLPFWNDGPANKSIVEFVEKVTKAGSPGFVPLGERLR